MNKDEENISRLIVYKDGKISCTEVDKSHTQKLFESTRRFVFPETKHKRVQIWYGNFCYDLDGGRTTYTKERTVKEIKNEEGEWVITESIEKEKENE